MRIKPLAATLSGLPCPPPIGSHLSSGSPAGSSRRTRMALPELGVDVMTARHRGQPAPWPPDTSDVGAGIAGSRTTQINTGRSIVRRDRMMEKTRPWPTTVRRLMAVTLLTPAALLAGSLWLASILWQGSGGPELGADELGAAGLGYNADVRPILADACFSCHGPDSASRKADLRLDQREGAIEMGAIAPEHPDESEMIRRIFSDDPDEVMPPPETKKTLTASEKETLVRWIREGAGYELHWSLLAPQRPELPVVSNEEWVRNPIDRFVLARLESAGLQPAPEADRRTLARRVSLDLTGLPPRPEQVEAFVADTSPDAYEKYVDSLLRSAHWGEHRARYWLDYARYADTHGIHFDNFREMWSYRDWVIKAFNDNMPFDEFTIENLAGDLLPNRTLDQQLGSGFNRCNMTTNEGGIIDEEYRVLYARDRTETTAQVWLGLTAGCAVCHSHKFDPLTQKEFYELSAFFNNTTQAVRDGNIQATPPIVVVPAESDRERWDRLPGEIAAAKAAKEAYRDSSRPNFEAWLTTATPDSIQSVQADAPSHLWAPLREGSGTTTRIDVEGTSVTLPLATSAEWQGEFAGQTAMRVEGRVVQLPSAGDFEADQAWTCTAWVRLPANDGAGAIVARMSRADGYQGWDLWVEQRRIGMHVVHRWPDQALKVVARDQLPANQWVHVAVSYDGSGKAAGVKVYYDGRPQETNVQNDRLSGSIKTQVPLTIGQRDQGEAFSGGLRDLRIDAQNLDPARIMNLAQSGRIATLLTAAAEQRTEAEQGELFEYWLATRDATYPELLARIGSLEAEHEQLKARGTVGYVMEERDEPAMAFVLFRGEYDQRREEVVPGTPQVLPPFPTGAPRNRLGLAQWLLLPEHPLTARVTVNRFWQEVFGLGIVKTSGDFGVSGELPSHPELLDWLAVEFRESGWDVKRLFKLIVMSATYRQSAETTPEKLERDPENRLLARGPRFRMDAEMVRDGALAVSGLLVPDDRWAQRQALSATGRVGGDRDEREQHPQLHARHGR